MSDIEIKHISKAFGDKRVLNDFSAFIEEGRTTCIMGPSGCGKTTLLRILAGLETVDEGEIVCDTKNISFVFQDDRLSENFSAVSNIKFVAGKSVSRKTIIEKLKAFELGDALEKPVSTLSGGMKRRVSIARALCVPYDLLIMDEPLKGLDNKLKSTVIEIIKEETKGKTVICVTHDLDEAEFWGNRIINMEIRDENTIKKGNY